MADLIKIMKTPGQLQATMTAMQDELEALEIAGAGGGGLVAVTLSGKGELKAVRIDDSLMKADEKEIVEDLLVAAHADARRKSEAVMADKMKALTGGLPLPPGMKLF